jgi:hypothetical protein
MWFSGGGGVGGEEMKPKCINLYPSSQLNLGGGFVILLDSRTTLERYVWILSMTSVPSNFILCFVFTECWATVHRWFFIQAPLMCSEILVGMWRSIWTICTLPIFRCPG